MRFIVRLLAVVGLLFIVLMAVIVIGISRIRVAGHAPAPVADHSVLTLAVAEPFTEDSPARTGLADLVAGRSNKLRDVIAGIDQGAKDTRIKGLILKIDGSAGMAQSQEIRAAIRRFRDAGKFAYAFADDFGAGASGNGQYYLAAACDQIWLQPMGEAAIGAVAFEAPFLKDALAKIDVDPEFVKRAEYKTAPETFTERGFSPAAREMMESLANDLTLQLTGDIGASRNLSPDQVRGVIDRGPMTADEAVAAKLIDHVGYADEVVAAAKSAAGDDARILPLGDYVRQTEADRKGKPNIALIYEVGDIDRVEGSIDPGTDPRGLNSGNGVIQGFARAMREPGIKAIIFRVDSPGGSVSGSESLRRMVVLAKQAGKKVVVSMGATAASGGYWISADADKIVADPATLTGSIGVFSGKFVVGKGLADIGVTVDRTAGGTFTGMDSPFTPFSSEQSQRLNALVDGIYDGFISRVATGRNLPPATVAQLARGRVWSGQQAKQLGLVDAVGGLYDAARLARDLGGIPADQPTMIAIYPEPLSPIEALRAMVSGNGDVSAAAATAIGGMEGPAGAVARILLPLFRNSPASMVRMPDLGMVK